MTALILSIFSTLFLICVITVLFFWLRVPQKGLGRKVLAGNAKAIAKAQPKSVYQRATRVAGLAIPGVLVGVGVLWIFVFGVTLGFLKMPPQAAGFLWLSVAILVAITGVFFGVRGILINLFKGK